MCARDHRRQLKVIFIFPFRSGAPTQSDGEGKGERDEQQEKVGKSASHRLFYICDAFRNVRNGLLSEPRWGSGQRGRTNDNGT